MFKCRETRCDDELLRKRRGIEQKKQDIEQAKAQKKIAKETEKDRKKRAVDADAVHKHIIKFDKRQANYEALISKDKDEEKYSAAELKLWCSVRKMKGDGVIPSKAEEVRTYAMMLEDREPLTIKQFLLDLEYCEDLVDSILSGDENGDSDDNGADIVDEGDRDDASTNDGGDIEDDALC